MRVRCDLHIHSCLSPCGDGEMTPSNITRLSGLLELPLIAVTDHNSCGNCRAVMEAGALAGVTVVPAMELTCREEAHVLCFFPELAAAEAFSAHVRSKLPDIRNNSAVFGPQTLLGPHDEPQGEEPLLLAAAADIGVYEIQALCHSFGGVAVPAHLNRSSCSILSALGIYDSAMSFPVCEITPYCRPELLVSQHPELAGTHFIKNSDAHALEQIGSAGLVLDLPEVSAKALTDYFLSFF